jgi:hypothetical protein
VALRKSPKPIPRALRRFYRNRRARVFYGRQCEYRSAVRNFSECELPHTCVLQRRSGYRKVKKNPRRSEMTEGQVGNRKSSEIAASGFAVSAPRILLRKGGGPIRGIERNSPQTRLPAPFDVSADASFRRPMIPPRAMVPWVSAGLPIPAITGKTDKRLPQFCDAGESDFFILSGAEDLVPVLEPDGTRFSEDTSSPSYVIHQKRPRIEGVSLTRHRRSRGNPSSEALSRRIKNWAARVACWGGVYGGSAIYG